MIWQNEARIIDYRSLNRMRYKVPQKSIKSTKKMLFSSDKKFGDCTHYFVLLVQFQKLLYWPSALRGIQIFAAGIPNYKN